MKDVFVQALLKQTNSESIMRTKRLIVTEADRPFPINHSEDIKMTYLINNWKHENCAQKAVCWFAECIGVDKDIKLPSELPFLLFKLMHLHQYNLSIVTSCLTILVHAVETGQMECLLTRTRYTCADGSDIMKILPKEINDLKKFWKTKNLNTVLSVMRKYFYHTSIQNLGFSFFDYLINAKHFTVNMDIVQGYLKTYDSIFKKLRKINLSRHIIEMMKCESKENIKIAINYLWKFCIYGKFKLGF
ncbi:unnamed protein product [Trichobilharzia regenti]|nr:unnamed protein product [Trichobilharzia regenti]